MYWIIIVGSKKERTGVSQRLKHFICHRHAEQPPSLFIGMDGIRQILCGIISIPLQYLINIQEVNALRGSGFFCGSNIVCQYVTFVSLRGGTLFKRQNIVRRDHENMGIRVGIPQGAGGRFQARHNIFPEDIPQNNHSDHS